MAVHTLGTSTTTSLNCVTYNPPQGVGVSAASSLLSPADMAAIAASITNDGAIAAAAQVNSAGPYAVLATGTTHGNTTLDTLVSTGGGPLATIQLGALVLGAGIPPGTFVAGFNNAQKTSIVLSQAATGSAANVHIAIVPAGAFGNNAFSFNGLLYVPNRGVLKVLPGDVVATDNTGWPILVSKAAIGYAGTEWDFT